MDQALEWRLKGHPGTCEEKEMNLETETPNEECGKPCPPDHPCEECEEYWDRMRREGYWVDGEGWTEKALKSWRR